MGWVSTHKNFFGRRYMKWPKPLIPFLMNPSKMLIYKALKCFTYGKKMLQNGFTPTSPVRFTAGSGLRLPAAFLLRPGAARRPSCAWSAVSVANPAISAT